MITAEATNNRNPRDSSIYITQQHEHALFVSFATGISFEEATSAGLEGTFVLVGVAVGFGGATVGLGGITDTSAVGAVK